MKKNQTETKRNCPICNLKNAQIVRNFEFETLKEKPIKSYDLVNCANCGFSYADTKITQKVLDEYYINLSKYEDVKISTGGLYNIHDKNRIEKMADFLSKNFKDKEIKILDIGCANGGLMKVLSDMGFKNVYGIDPSKVSVDYIKDNYKLKAFQSSLFDIKHPFKNIDLIIVSHVFEHVLDLKTAIQSISKLLSADGCIYIECPDAENYSKVIHAPYQEINTEHINHFTVQSYKNLAHYYPFKVKKSGQKKFLITDKKYYYANYCILQLTKNDKKSALTFDTTSLKGIKDYLKQSDIIWARMKKIFDKLNKENLAFWGIGEFGYKILNYLKNKNGLNKKYLFFDNNTTIVNKTIAGSKILSSSEITKKYKQNKFDILITSTMHEKDIRKKIEQIFIDSNISLPKIIGLSECIVEKK